MSSAKSVIVGSVDDVFAEPAGIAPLVSRPQNNISIRRCGSETFLIGLTYPAALYFQGILEVNVLCGKLLVNGYVASNTDKRLPLKAFSLKEGSAQCLSTTADSRMTDCELERYCHDRQFIKMLNELLTITQPVGCVLCVSSKIDDFSSWKTCLDRHQFDLFPTVENATGVPPFPEAEGRLRCVLDVEDGYRIPMKLKFSDELGDLSRQLLTALENNSGTNLTTVVCGGKGVGKSTYLKYLLNSFLSQTSSVVYIDLDIGQPEFTLCGTVSVLVIDTPLVGPNYSHLTSPFKSYFVGDVNPVQCLNTYMSAVTKIFEFCQNNELWKSVPWLVNTMGMTKGLGLDIIVSIISHVRPNHVVQFNSSKRQDNYQVPLTPQFLKTFSPNLRCKPLHNLDYAHHLVTSVSKAQSRLKSLPSSPKLRESMAIIYLADILSKENMEEEAKWLQLSWSDETIFGDIVALCQKENDSPDICLGFGMIYKIFNEKRFAILSPMEDDLFQTVNRVRKAPVSFKASAILEHFKQHVGTLPHFSIFNMKCLNVEKKDVLKVLFALE